MSVFDKVDNTAINVGMQALLNRSKSFYGQDFDSDDLLDRSNNFFDTPSSDVGGFGLDNNHAPQMDLSDTYDEKAFHMDKRLAKNGWTVDGVPVVENITYDIPVENFDFSESFSKRIAEYEMAHANDAQQPKPEPESPEEPEKIKEEHPVENKKVETEPNSMDSKIRDLVLKIIYKDIRKMIIRNHTSRNETFNDIKLDNEVKNWYWNVGFVDVIINGDLITIVVNRPNKFLGKDNYLHTLRKNLANIGGFKVELQKAPDSDIYKSFFGK